MRISRYKVIGVGSPDENNLLNMFGKHLYDTILHLNIIQAVLLQSCFQFSIAALIFFFYVVFFSIFHMLQLKMH